MRSRGIVTLLGAFVLMLALPAVAMAVPQIPSNAFEPVENCGCHSAFQITWTDSMHAKALVDPIYQYELELAIRASDGALGPYCNSCHGPIAVMSGEIDGLDQGDLSNSSDDAISCDFCHQVTGRIGDVPGNSSYALDSPDGTKRAQFDDSSSPYHETAYSAFHESAEFCGNCHDVFHPVNGLQLEGTYTEWKNGPYAAEGIVCQDCHMTPGPGVVKPNPGSAAGFGTERPHIYTMTFAGGNVALGDAVLAEERLQAAAEVTMTTPDYVAPGETGEVDVKITNVGAGHYLPTGLTEFRQMWLEVVAVDDEGNEELIGEHHYGMELANEAGNYPVPLWEAVSVGHDDRIPPQESVEYTYELTMPEGGAVDVVATLYYRSISEELAEEIDIEIPTTTMASVDEAVYGSAEAAAEALLEAGADDESAGGFSTLAIAVLALGGAVVLIVFFAMKGRKSHT